jgi:hypothetical protein
MSMSLAVLATVFVAIVGCLSPLAIVANVNSKWTIPGLGVALCLVVSLLSWFWAVYLPGQHPI